MMHRQNNDRFAAGFTLVEILIVVVILGILAAIVVPQFTSAAAESRDSSVRMSLYRMRQQLEIYKEHHDGEYPTLAGFIAQMTGRTNVSGEPVESGTAGAFGPYVREIPVNPNTGGRVVSDAEVGGSDWYYDEDTGLFQANDSIITRSY